MASRHFADLSNNNASFNAKEYAAAGHLLVGLKATEGVGYVDSAYRQRVLLAHAAGLSVAHYHFCRPDLHPEGRLEAVAFWGAVKGLFGPADLLVVDLEVWPRPGGGGPGPYLRALDRHLTALSGHRAIGYTYTAYMAAAGPGLQVASHRWWMAAYGSGVPRLGHRRWRWAHQYTDGQLGAGPRSFAGIGQCDGSLLSRAGLAHLKVARARRWRQRRK